MMIYQYMNISNMVLTMEERNVLDPCWISVERPGYLGKQKDILIQKWNAEFGEGNWRIIWEFKNGDKMEYLDIFWKVFVASYVKHFYSNLHEAQFLAENYAYAYDKELISKKDAFDPYALYNKPGKPDQFHNVAVNIAVEWFLGISFKGNNPIQIREGKPTTPISEWPSGWKWSPGRIAYLRPDIIPNPALCGWWQQGSIEEAYQSSKVLQIKKG